MLCPVFQGNFTPISLFAGSNLSKMDLFKEYKNWLVWNICIPYPAFVFVFLFWSRYPESSYYRTFIWSCALQATLAACICNEIKMLLGRQNTQHVCLLSSFGWIQGWITFWVQSNHAGVCFWSRKRPHWAVRISCFGLQLSTFSVFLPAQETYDTNSEEK